MNDCENIVQFFFDMFSTNEEAVWDMIECIRELEEEGFDFCQSILYDIAA